MGEAEHRAGLNEEEQAGITEAETGVQPGPSHLHFLAQPCRVPCPFACMHRLVRACVSTEAWLQINEGSGWFKKSQGDVTGKR